MICGPLPRAAPEAVVVICLSPRLSHAQRNTMQCTGSFSSLGRCGTAAACCCCPLLPAACCPHPACSHMLVSKIKPHGDALQVQWFIILPWLLLLPAAARNAWNLRLWWISGDPQKYGTCDSNGFRGPCVECVGLVTLANAGHHKTHAADMDLMGCSKRWAP